MASQSEIVVKRQRPTSQFIEVEQTPVGGGSASRSIQRRPVSSVYSQVQQVMNYAPADNNRASSIYPPTISPPDSPRHSDDHSSNANISPISTSAAYQPWMRPSAIPVPRRQSKLTESPEPEPAPEARLGWRQVVSTIGRSPSPENKRQESEDQSQTRWDTYSGEQARDGRGKPAAASPTQHPYTGNVQGMGYSAQITTGANPKPSHFLGVKLRKTSDRRLDTNQPFQPAEPWKGPSGVRGASGRTAVVDPVRDRPVPAEKRHFPTPAERRAKGLFVQKPGNTVRASPGPNIGLGIRSVTPTGRVTPQTEEKERGASSTMKAVTGALSSMRDAAASVLPQRDKSPDPPRPLTSISDEPAGEVIVSEPIRYRYRVGGGSSSRDESPMTPISESESLRNPHHELNQLSSNTGLRTEHVSLPTGRSFSQPVHAHTYTESPTTYDNLRPLPLRKDSRFLPSSSSRESEIDVHRITSAFHDMGFSNEPKSHFSATTYNTSLADSPPTTPRMPGIDEVPPLPMPPTELSVLNRKRPVPSASNQFRAKPPSRKPTPSQAQNEVLVANGSGADSDQLQKPVDRVALLEEKLANLNKRKASLAAVIHELTNVVQPSSIAYDMASRTEIKKTVEGLKIEQDAVLKEIQETGIKLHRALRRRDEGGGGGGTGLWVRRVTE